MKIHTFSFIVCRIELCVSMSIVPKRDVPGKSVVKKSVDQKCGCPTNLNEP